MDVTPSRKKLKNAYDLDETKYIEVLCFEIQNDIKGTLCLEILQQ